MIKLESGGKYYKAELKEDKQGYSVSVFLLNEKMPIYGTRFGLRASFENEIMPWIKEKCRKNSSGEIETINIF